MSIFDLVIIVWLFALTVVSLLSYRTKTIYIKKIKNKRDIKSKRYVVFDIISQENLELEEIEESIRNAVKELGGKLWLEIANPKVIMIYQNHGIISTNRIGYKIIIASLPLAKVQNKRVLFVPRRTTGSLKRAKKLIGIK